MNKKNYDEIYSYEIFDDGYDIFKHNKKVITQRGTYSKPMDPEKTFEENAILQIESIIEENSKEKRDFTFTEQLRSDLDFISLMLDIPLPSEEEEFEDVASEEEEEGE